MAKSLVAQINDVLDDFYQVVRDEFELAAKEVGDEAVQQLRAVQWKTKTGKNYSRGWKLKRERWGSYIVHNSTNYQLTHLLENGHVVINGKGDTGKRASAHKHIEPVYEWVQGQLEREERQRIERGNG